MLDVKSIFVTCSAFIFVGCSSQSVQETSAGDIDDWILNPSIENGIAVSDCVLFSGNMSVDRKQAIANARALLAGEIEVKIESLDETYADKTQLDDKTSSGTSFSSVSRQVTEKTLKGSRTYKTDIVEISGKDNLCVLLGIEEGKTKELFDGLVSASNKTLSPNDESVLFQQFKAQKARERLDEALN